MKKLLILLMAFALLTACKNNKGASNTDSKSTNTREKDDYRSNDSKDSKDNTDKMESKDSKDNSDNSNKNNTNTDNQNTENASTGWTRTDENRFMDDCEGTATPKVGSARANQYCRCMLAKLKKIYDSYNDADRKMANFTKEEIDDFAASCNR